MEDGGLNLRLVLGILYFFKRYLLNSVEDISRFFTALEPELRPQMWTEPLDNELKPLGKRWIGTYGR